MAEQVGPDAGALEVAGEVAGGEERADRLGRRAGVVRRTAGQRHRLVEHRHPLGDATGLHVGEAAVGERLGLEVDVAELAGPVEGQLGVGEQHVRIGDFAAHRGDRDPALFDARRLLIDEPARSGEPCPTGVDVAHRIRVDVTQTDTRHCRVARLARLREAPHRGRQLGHDRRHVAAGPRLARELQGALSVLHPRRGHECETYTWVRPIGQTAGVGRGLRVAVIALVLVTAAACADDDDSADSAATSEAAPATVLTTTSPPTAPPTIAPATSGAATLPATDVETTTTATAPPTTPATTEPPGPQWTETPVAGCVCSDGSPLKIYERVNDPTKVVLYFEGGGACFSEATCDPNGSPTYQVNREGLTPSSLAMLRGYFDASNPENPLATDSIVYVPYCTGDVHEGNITTDYGGGVVIEHRGYVNATKALDYLVAQYPDAQQVVVTGESAGSVPTALFGALVADRLPNASVVTFGDSSGAIPTSTRSVR